jgi:peptidoglycan/LPS O-acetylase OafA/YrhL
MQFYLKARHWQIFLMLMFGLVINNYVVEDNPTLTTILNLAGYLIYFSWPLFVGHGLQEYIPRKVELTDTFFLINGFIAMATYLVIMILSDGQGMTFNGVEALPIFYVFYAFFYFLSFPGKSLRTIENKRLASLGEYIGDFFLVLFLPIGIWFLQPRINKIVEQQPDEIMTEEDLNQ